MTKDWTLVTTGEELILAAANDDVIIPYPIGGDDDEPVCDPPCGEFQVKLFTGGLGPVLTHRARTPGKWTQMDKATFGLRTATPSQKQNAFSINHVDAWHLY